MSTKISNPLTVVAIFAGLAEAFATYALVNLPSEIQQLFVYFVMAFPMLIVLLFFAVLNWNHTVLYAPSDFGDESMYLESLKLVKSKFIDTLSNPVSGTSLLTPTQIEAASIELEKVIKSVSISPRGQQVLDLLVNGPMTMNQITQVLDITSHTAIRLLRALEKEGRVVRGIHDEVIGQYSRQISIWSLSSDKVEP
jgi:DNA-binding CsgD family transcriptional regulator